MCSCYSQFLLSLLFYVIVVLIYSRLLLSCSQVLPYAFHECTGIFRCFDNEMIDLNLVIACSESW